MRDGVEIAPLLGTEGVLASGRGWNIDLSSSKSSGVVWRCHCLVILILGKVREFLFQLLG